MAKTYKRCILLLVDGSRPDVFQELCEAGEMPVCEKLFKNGGRFSDAVSVFPSTTGPAYLPFLTGCYPGTCNLPGIRWFDKKIYGEGKPRLKRYRSYVGFESFFMNHDMKVDHPTLFQCFENPVNIFSAVNKGSKFSTNKTKMSRIWYWYYAHLTDRWAMVDAAATEKLIKALDGEVDFAFVVYPAVDEYSHFGHPRHEMTLEAYRNIDRSLGKIVQKLEQRGWMDETLIAIVSDHGLSQTHEHFGVASFLEEKGLKTFYYPKIFKWNFDAASMVSGNGMLHLYFRDDSAPTATKGWVGRTAFSQLEQERQDLLQGLLAQEAVDILAGQENDGSIAAVSRRGRANIRKNGDRLHYAVQGGDPFGYAALPREMSDRESLRLTASSEYPDALAQLLQIFRSPRTGDWVISARKGWDLRKRFEHPEHRGSHGGLIKEHMLVPFFCNAPLPSETVRTCDVYPTILKLMGRDVPAGIDGISLV
ncbi:MAG: alkaline phosphatase family protein [bacterium]